MANIVRNVGEERAARTQQFHGLEGLVHGRVHGMRVTAQRFEEQDVEPSQFLQALRRDIAVVGEIGAVAEAKSMYGRFAVCRPDGLYVDAGNRDLLFSKGV